MSDYSYSMPWGFPYFEPPPFILIGNRVVNVLFETDATALRRLVPEPLIPKPEHMARIYLGKMALEDSSYWMEAGLLVPVRFNNTPGQYVVCLYLDQALPIVGGREIWGAPKVDAQIALSEEPGHVTATIARNGSVLAEIALSLHPKSNILPKEPIVPWIFLKLIPSVRENHLPDIMQLTSLPIPVTLQEFATGDVNLSLPTFPEDPLGILPVLNIVQGSFEISDWTLGFGEVLVDYLTEKEVSP